MNDFRNGRQVPYPLTAEGKGEQGRLVSRSQAILNTLINLLPSNYSSTVVGPSYTIYMKAMATELARITMVLETLGEGITFESVQSEFLWETVGYLVFLNQKIPDIGFDDESFREFLLAVIRIYFQGATPEAMRQGVALFTREDFRIRENFKEAAYDISDQFGFGIDFELAAQFPEDVFALDRNLQLLIEIIRPAHTLYRLRFVFGEDADVLGTATDESTWWMYNYYYDDARGYCNGMQGFSGSAGVILGTSLNTLTDTTADKPLHSIQVGATLLIPTGDNTGRYTVTGHPTDTSITVFPRFKKAEAIVSYQVEVDRLGRKKEIFVSENVSDQFYSTSRLTLDAGNYVVAPNAVVTLNATSNGIGVTFTWDLDGDNTYETTGPSPTYTAPATVGTYPVWVTATDNRGRRAKTRAIIEVTYLAFSPAFSEAFS